MEEKWVRREVRERGNMVGRGGECEWEEEWTG
jgi:hypothetical protein